MIPQPGDTVTLIDEPDCIVPAGDHVVSMVDGDLLFLGGKIGVWMRRVSHVNGSPMNAGPVRLRDGDYGVWNAIRRLVND